MDRVFTFADPLAEAGHWVVVAVGEHQNQRHIGVMHRDSNGQLHFLHLARHCHLRNDHHRPKYLSVWVAPGVPAERQRIVAAFCRRVWRKNERDGIPYAFSNPQDSLDPATGAFLVGPTRFGLTCSSFVLALFHAAGLQLAVYESWPADRAGDREWQQSIIAALESLQTEQVHIDHLRGEVGAVRFRPEEVAASAAHAPPPTEFQWAEPFGQQIVNRIREAAGPT